ncbi:hypothetical protein RI367_006709 [Sorochytrium milnesiophthora]
MALVLQQLGARSVLSRSLRVSLRVCSASLSSAAPTPSSEITLDTLKAQSMQASYANRMLMINSPRLKQLPKAIQKEFAATPYQALLLRQTTIDVAAQVQEKRRPIIIDGAGGVGKSAALLQIVSHAQQAGWFVVYVPNAVQLTEGRYPYRKDSTSELYEQPQLAVELLTAVRDLNGSLCDKITTGQSYQFGDVKVASGSKLTALINAGTKDAEIATPVWAAVLKELSASKSVPVLVAVDQVNALFAATMYKDTASQRLMGTSLSVAHHLAGCFSGQTKLANGTAVGATSKLDTFAQPVSGIRSHVAKDSLVVDLRPYTRDEASSLMQYYRASRMLFSEPNDSLLNKCMLLSAGNGRKFYYACAKGGAY